MMNPLRLSTVTISVVLAPVLRSVVLAAGIVGLLAISGPEGRQTSGTTPRMNSASSSSANEELVATLQPTSLQSGSPQSGAVQPSAMSNDDLSQTQSGQTHPDQASRDQIQPDQAQRDQTRVAMADPSPAGVAAIADTSIANASIVKIPEPPATEMAWTDAPQVPPTEHVPPTEPGPVQVATANPQDGVSSFSDLASILREADKGARSFDLFGRCTTDDSCDVDQYLWALYQRTPKEDAIKMVELRNVTIERKIKGKKKTVTVTRASTKLVQQDFGWKDPKAAERAGMPLMDYVIGGMDRSFKIKLFNMLRAAEAAGFSPGITSGFRDDYRQSIASGLKAASNRSYHGGSMRGGYGHGLAADVVSVQGGSRDQRFAASARFWNWIDANGKEYGIGRPYLGRDPPHVAPTDGQEYAKHNRGTRLAALNAKNASTKQAASNAKDASTKPAASSVKETSNKPTASGKKNANTKLAASSVKQAKRAARDVPRISKREAARDSARSAKRPRTAAASRLKDS